VRFAGKTSSLIQANSRNSRCNPARLPRKSKPCSRLYRSNTSAKALDPGSILGELRRDQGCFKMFFLLSRCLLYLNHRRSLPHPLSPTFTSSRGNEKIKNHQLLNILFPPCQCPSLGLLSASLSRRTISANENKRHPPALAEHESISRSPGCDAVLSGTYLCRVMTQSASFFFLPPLPSRAEPRSSLKEIG
jgi:hypothetical protein